MNIDPIIKGTLNSCYDYEKMFSIQRNTVVGKIEPVKKSNSCSKSKSKSLILRKSPRSTNRHK